MDYAGGGYDTACNVGLLLDVFQFRIDCLLVVGGYVGEEGKREVGVGGSVLV